MGFRDNLKNSGEVIHSWSAYRIEGRETLILALPIVVTQLAHISLSFVDTVMVGRLGPSALAGVSLGSTVFFSTMIFCMGILLAVGPMVSQAYGAKNNDAIGRSVRQGLWMALALSLAAFVVANNGEFFLLLLGQSETNAAAAGSYLFAISWGIPSFLGFIALRAFVEAVSRPKVVTVIALIGVGLNVLLNYLLMFGKWGFPELGLVGTGWASSCVFTFNFVVLLIYIAKQKAFLKYRIFSRLGRPDPQYFKDLFRIGWPIGSSMGVEMGLFMLTVFMMGWIGTTQLAAHQVAIQCASFTFMVPVGIGMATSIRVGQAIGQQDHNRAAIAGFTGIGFSTMFMFSAALLFWLVPRAIVSLYLDLDSPGNAEVIEMAVGLLSIAAVFQVFDGVQASVMGALRGMKDTRAPMVISVFSYWGVGLVSGYLLAFRFDYGEKGLWWGLVVGLAAASILLTRRFYHLSHPK